MLRPVLLPALFAVSAFAADPFAEGVRTSDPLKPEQQRAAFRLPAGFEIQLVAAEPDLRKPMNMAFDAEGRLWITESREYPFPAKPGAPARDTVRVLSDFGPDGRARKVEVFADGLNIPIGLYPFRSGNTWKCIVWAIPNIWLMEDTDSDGKADKREVLFGPLGWEKDTHGNQASFRRGADGWLYGTHGFNNQSTFKAKDGSTITMHSGNTWRIRLDGSRVEQHTWGQVNPFGLCWDDRGNLFSADCHSSPIYQLLRGATYPSFGKPDDGLGFAPQTVQHSHGSTAICAPMLITDRAWPAEINGHMLIGNVMSSRLNHDAIEWRGASSKGKELPDFLTTSDPWFRPVDLQWGPDGALYIADFYNRIIGHYEVPLTHPGRDRERGRIWRVVYRGKDGKGIDPGPLPKEVDGWVRELASTNPTRRSLALQEICDRYGKGAVSTLQGALERPVNAFQKLGALWALQRLGALKLDALLAAIKDADPLVRTHAVRVADARASWTAAGEARESREIAKSVQAALNDSDAIVQRLAAEALAAHPGIESFQPLLDLLRRTPKEDDHLIHSVRLALRDHLRVPQVASGLSLENAKPEELRALFEIMLSVPGEHTALLRLALFERVEVTPEQVAKQLPSMIKNLPLGRLDAALALGRKHLHGNLHAQAELLHGVAEVFAQRGMTPDENLRKWGGEVVNIILSESRSSGSWKAHALDGGAVQEDVWAFQERACSDGEKAQVMSSFPRGEQGRGVLRSAVFAAPEKLRFYLCGHDGVPAKPPGGKNMVRLCDANDGQVLRMAPPPRNDTAKRTEWDLKDLAGRRVYFEAVDGDDQSAYAWLAFGRFKPALPELALNDPASLGKRLALGADLATAFSVRTAAAVLAEIFADSAVQETARVAAGKAWLNVERAAAIGAIAKVIGDATASPTLREQVATLLGGISERAVEDVLVATLSSAPHKLQQALAGALSSTKGGAVRLLDAFENGKASATLLRNKGLIDRIKAQGDEAGERLAKLVASLPPANAEADRLIAARRSAFHAAKADEKRGAAVFSQYCAVCHQIGQKGNVVGPQLDGIGARGLDRILEDLVDPNRNVDRAFRMSVVTLADGSVLSGLYRREEGETLVLADLTGKEQSVPKSKVKARTESETSLMPPSLVEAIPSGDFADLLAFLLAEKATH